MTATESATALDTALERGIRRLLELQRPEGYWVGELESNATMVAEHLFMLHFLGLRDPETDRKLANELLARRRDDGTWAIWWEGPRRPLGHGRGLRRPEAGRRRRGRGDPCVHRP